MIYLLWGIVSGLLNAAGLDEDTQKSIIKLLGEKNSSSLKSLCEEMGVGSAISSIAVSLCEISGKAAQCISSIEKLCINREMIEAAAELRRIITALDECGLADNIYIDFSIINDTKYYNGIVFRGYVDSLPKSVLSGGRYDNLLKGMGKQGGAIGFAVYSDMLERIDSREKEYDCDVLLTYDDGVSFADITKATELLKEKGGIVNIQKDGSSAIRYKEKKKVLKGGEIING